jgi:predicted regulator of Ras-like GTPase activity (Roadblock/LC7/MglB family)
MTEEKRKLLFLEEDVAQVVQALEPFQQTARTRANLLMDRDGQTFAQVGNAQLAPETLTALVAASELATRGILQIVQQDELVTLTHEGKSSSLQVTHAVEGTLLVTVFDAKTTVGALVFYLRDVMDKINAIVKVVATREVKNVDLGADFKDSSDAALDDMFGEGEAEKS